MKTKPTTFFCESDSLTEQQRKFIKSQIEGLSREVDKDYTDYGYMMEKLRNIESEVKTLK